MHSSRASLARHRHPIHTTLPPVPCLHPHFAQLTLPPPTLP
ncbi:hypothetical protein E2C01_065948 [Portunus trituberculatus]|uniref:Uncharacterized protein n=1 Tax=Portunus trituberculatus TaxID=210409 RepID=A0A5B7HT83_PORTR|nr:hypothetical protein [Portunus trituberculatus]